MVIKYSDSNRISVLSSDFPTTTTTYDHIGDTNNAGFHAINSISGNDGTKVGIKIIAGSPAIGTKIEYVSMSIRKWNSANGNYLFQVIDGTDDTTVLASATSSASALTETAATVELQLDSVVTLSVNDRIVLSYPDGDGTTMSVGLARNSATTESGYNRSILGYSTTTWTDSTINNMIMTFDSSPATVSKPTNVETNSILVERDTGKRYWFDGTTWIIKPTYYSDFLISTEWTQIGSGISVTGGKLKGNAFDSSGNNRVYHLLGSINDTAWVMRFEYTPTSSAAGAYYMPIGLTVGAGGLNEGVDAIRLWIDMGSYTTFWRSKDGSTEGNAGTQYNLTAGTKYYYTVTNDNRTLTSVVRTGSHTGTAVSTGTTTIQAGVTGLTHIQSGSTSFNAGTNTYSIDNLEFYNGVTSIS